MQEILGANDPLRGYFQMAQKHPPMTLEEERNLALQSKAGNKEAGQRMVLANLRLVVKIAHDYHSHPSNFLDFIQEGIMGLMHAVGKYDPEHDPENGSRFPNYASFWIRAFMLKYLMKSGSIVKFCTTDNSKKLFFRLGREVKKVEDSGGIPSREILAGNLGVSVADVEKMEQFLKHGDVSIDVPRYDDSSDLFVDSIRSSEDIEEALIKKDLLEKLHKKLDIFKEQLNEKERFILDNRIMSDDPMTLMEIGELFSVTKERIRQLQVRVLKGLVRIKIE